MFLCTPLLAQGLRQDMNLTTIQRYSFDKVLVGEHFEISFTSGMDSAALRVLQTAGSMTGKIEKLLGYRLSGKIRIYLHPDPMTFFKVHQPQRFRLKYQHNSGGNTLIQQNEFDLIYNGGNSSLSSDISYGICKVLLYEMLYGGTVQEKIKYASMLQLPEWFIPGLCAYVAGKWDANDDNQMRMLIQSRQPLQLDNLSPSEQIVAGKSIWIYMALVKGESSFQRILYLVRLTRKLENATYFVFNWNIQELIKSWQQFNVGVYSRDIKRRLPQIPEPKIGKHDQIVQLVANGESYYVLVWRQKKYRLLHYDKDGSYNEIFKSNSMNEEEASIFKPLIASAGEDEVVLLEKSNGLHELNFFKGKSRFRSIELPGSRYISDFQIDPNKGVGYLSILKNGNPYFETVQLTTVSTEKLLPLPFCITDMSFDASTSSMLFSAKSVSAGMFDVYQWYLYDSSKTWVNLTETPEMNERQPQNYKNNQVTFLSDLNGIYNSYALSLTDKKLVGLTDYKYGITQAVFNQKTGQVAEIVKWEKQFHWFISDIDSVWSNKQNIRIPAYTYFREKPTEGEIIFITSDTLIIETDTQPTQIYFQTDFPENADFPDNDSLNFENPDHGFEPFVMPSYSFLVPKLLVTQLDNSWLNTYYASAYALPEEILYIPLGFNFALKLSEISNQYHLILGSRIARNFNQFDYSVEFEWFKYRLPIKAELFRQSKRHFRTSAGYHKITTDFLSIGVIFPFKKFSNLGVFLSNRLDMHQFLSTESTSLLRNARISNYTGPNIYWILDRKKDYKPGLYAGLKFKSYGQYFLNTTNGKSLTYAGTDARHGLRVFKNAYWMNRVQAEFSVGAEKVNYMLGGQENWLFPDFKSTNVLVNTPGFYRLASSMRGFNYNVRNGNAFALWNTEFRYRPLGHLVKWNTRSELLSHLLLTVFSDLGTSWYGKSPFDLRSPLNTSVIQSGSMSITHYNRKQPLVAGVGYGVRTSIFGYYLKFDKSWGYENAQWGRSVNYITLGRDF